MEKKPYLFFASNLMFIAGILFENNTLNIHFIFFSVPILFIFLIFCNSRDFKFISSMLIYVLLFLLGILFVRFEKVKKFKKTDLNIENCKALVIISEKSFDINKGYNGCDFIIKKVKINDKWIDVDKKILIRVNFKNDNFTNRIECGDSFLIINAKDCGELENIDDDDYGYDSYCQYLIDNGIYYIFTTDISNLNYIGNYNIFSFDNFFYRTRNNLRDRLVKYIKNDNSKQILSNLIFGKCSLINKNLKNNYVKTNLTHILAISGLHLCLILLIISFFLNRYIMNKNLVFLIILIFVWFYGFIISMPSSILRSLIMLTFLIINMILDKKCPKYYFITNSFIFSLILNPLWIYSLGFLLSYSATFGILFSCNFIYELILIKHFQSKTFIIKIINFLFSNMNKYIISQISLSLSVMIFSAPIVLYFFHKINLISLFSNIIIIPLFTIILFFSFLVIIFSFISIPFLYEYLSIFLDNLMIFTNYIIYYISQYNFSIIEVNK